VLELPFLYGFFPRRGSRCNILGAAIITCGKCFWLARTSPLAPPENAAAHDLHRRNFKEVCRTEESPKLPCSAIHSGRMKMEGDLLEDATEAVPQVGDPLQSPAVSIPQSRNDPSFRFLGCQDPYCSGQPGGRIRKTDRLYNQIRHQVYAYGTLARKQLLQRSLHGYLLAAVAKLFGLTSFFCAFPSSSSLLCNLWPIPVQFTVVFI
jgi:hypothetical protein